MTIGNDNIFTVCTIIKGLNLIKRDTGTTKSSDLLRSKITKRLHHLDITSEVIAQFRDNALSKTSGLFYIVTNPEWAGSKRGVGNLGDKIAILTIKVGISIKKLTNKIMSKRDNIGITDIGIMLKQGFNSIMAHRQGVGITNRVITTRSIRAILALNAIIFFGLKVTRSHVDFIALANIITTTRSFGGLFMARDKIVKLTFKSLNLTIITIKVFSRLSFITIFPGLIETIVKIVNGILVKLNRTTVLRFTFRHSGRTLINKRVTRGIVCIKGM